MGNNLYKIANKTTKLLYSDKKCVYENLGKIEKRVERINYKFKNNEMLNFNIDSYDEESLAEFFAVLIKSIDYQIINGVNRKFLDNLSKLDWSIDMDNAYAIFISKECNVESQKTKNIIENCRYINNYIMEYKSYLRAIIRQKDSEGLIKYKQAKEILDGFLKSNIEKELVDNLNKLKIIEELFSDLLIQTIIYEIANNKNVEIEKKEELLKNLKSSIDSFDIVKESNSTYGVFNDFAIRLFYLNRKKELETEVDIVRKLIIQNKEETYNRYPLDKFQCNGRIIRILESQERYIKNFLNMIDPLIDYSVYTLDKCQIELENILTSTEGEDIQSVLNIQELKEIITEGDKKVKNIRFKEKLELSWSYCDFLQKYAGRNLLPFYLQHIKVIYREIFIDKMKFNNRTTHTIMQDLQERIINDLESQKLLGHNKESYFLLEKISRGFYREKNNIDMYNIIGDIRIAYYNKILKIYKFNSIEEAICCMIGFIEYIDKEVIDILSKI